GRRDEDPRDSPVGGEKSAQLIAVGKQFADVFPVGRQIVIPRVVVVKSAVDVLDEIHNRQSAVNAGPIHVLPRFGEGLELGDSPQDVRFFNRPGVFSLDYDVEVHRAREPFADLVQTDARLGIRLGEMEVIYVDHNAAHADGADHDDYRGQDVERCLVRRGPAPDAFQQFDHSAAKPDAEPDRAFAQQYQRR